MAIENIGDLRNEVSGIIESYEEVEDDDSDSIVASERYEAIGKMVSTVLKSGRTPGEYTMSDKIDKIVTNKWLGLPIFAGIMFIVYYISITTIGGWGTDWVNDVFFAEMVIPGVESFLMDLDVNPLLTAADGLLAGAVWDSCRRWPFFFLLLVILKTADTARILHHGPCVQKVGLEVLHSVDRCPRNHGVKHESERAEVTAMTTTSFRQAADNRTDCGSMVRSVMLIALASYFIGILAVLISYRRSGPRGLPSVHNGIASIQNSGPIAGSGRFDRVWSFVRKAEHFHHAGLRNGMVPFGLWSLRWWTITFDTGQFSNAVTWIFIPRLGFECAIARKKTSSEPSAYCSVTGDIETAISGYYRPHGNSDSRFLLLLTCCAPCLPPSA